MSACAWTGGCGCGGGGTLAGAGSSKTRLPKWTDSRQRLSPGLGRRLACWLGKPRHGLYGIDWSMIQWEVRDSCNMLDSFQVHWILDPQQKDQLQIQYTISAASPNCKS